MSEKILLDAPRTHGGIAHALKTWNTGLHLSSHLNAKWIKCQKQDPDFSGYHGTKVKEFLDYFGLNKEIENKKFDDIYKANNVLEILYSSDLDTYEKLLKYVQENSEYNVFFLNSVKTPFAYGSLDPWNLKTKRSKNWFQKRKKNNNQSLCDKNYFNISLAIRRGDRIFIPFFNGLLPSDKWFLDKLKKVLELINDPRPIKIHLFAETYNKTWYEPEQIAGCKWDDARKNIHPDGSWLVDEFLNKNFSKIENIYVDEQGRPSDIEGMFAEYNAKLYLNEDIFTVLDTLIESDVVISKEHGTAGLILFYSKRKETIENAYFLEK